MKQVKQGETVDLEFKNVTLSGIKLDAFITAQSTNTAVVDPGIDPSKVNIFVQLRHEDGSTHTICNGILYPLLLASAYFDGSWQRVFAYATSYNPIITKAAASGVYETSIMPQMLNFPSPVNVTGGDVLQVRVRINDDACAATASSANSYIGVEVVNTIANSSVIPQIEVWSIDAGQNQMNMVLGDNIQAIFALNTDKNSVLTADAPISNVKIDSDKLNINRTWGQLLTDREDQFTDPLSAADHKQCFCLFDGRGAELDDASMLMDLTSSNVNVGKNYVVVYRYKISRSQLLRAQNRAARHNNAYKIKLQKAL